MSLRSPPDAAYYAAGTETAPGCQRPGDGHPALSPAWSPSWTSSPARTPSRAEAGPDCHHTGLSSSAGAPSRVESTQAAALLGPVAPVLQPCLGLGPPPRTRLSRKHSMQHPGTHRQAQWWQEPAGVSALSSRSHDAGSPPPSAELALDASCRSLAYDTGDMQTAVKLLFGTAWFLKRLHEAQGIPFSVY